MLAEQFEAQRGHLWAVAYRMLGSQSEAEDAVQEAWIRLTRSDTSGVENIRGWLTTVVARVALDMLRSRRSRREEPLETIEGVRPPRGVKDPEEEAVLAESVSLALLVVLDTLGPAERVAFVLHDLFAVPFDEIGVVLNRSAAAAKQLASRARQRVQNGAGIPRGDDSRRREVVQAFLAASRAGDFTGLLALLDPNVALRADPAAGAPGIVLGSAAVASTFAGRAQAAEPALIDGCPGAVWAPGGRPRVAFQFTIIDHVITAITMITDREHLRELDMVVVSGDTGDAEKP